MTTISADLDRELNQMADDELRGTPRKEQQMISMERDVDVPSDDKNLAIITHIGTIAAAVFTAGFLDIVVPAVAYFLFKDRSEFLKSHVKHQLNFQLTLLLVTAIAVVFSIVTLGFGALIAVPAIVFFFIVDIVCSIIAAVKASKGEDYAFPFSINFLK